MNTDLHRLGQNICVNPCSSVDDVTTVAASGASNPHERRNYAGIYSRNEEKP